MKLFKDINVGWPWFVLGTVNTLMSFSIVYFVGWLLGFPGSIWAMMLVVLGVLLVRHVVDKIGNALLRRLLPAVDTKIADSYSNHGTTLGIAILFVLIFPL